MEYILILTLLASNIFLIGKFLKKVDSKPPDPNPELPPAETKETESSASPPNDEDMLITKSIVDLSRINALIESKVKAKVANMVDEMVERVVQEMTKPEDVGLLPEEPESSTPTIPQDKLDETFTHHTVSETSGNLPNRKSLRQASMTSTRLKAQSVWRRMSLTLPKKPLLPKRLLPIFREQSLRIGLRLTPRCVPVCSRLSTVTRMSRSTRRQFPRRRSCSQAPSTLSMWINLTSIF